MVVNSGFEECRSWFHRRKQRGTNEWKWTVILVLSGYPGVGLHNVSTLPCLWVNVAIARCRFWMIVHGNTLWIFLPVPPWLPWNSNNAVIMRSLWKRLWLRLTNNFISQMIRLCHGWKCVLYIKIVTELRSLPTPAPAFRFFSPLGNLSLFCSSGGA